MWTQFRGRCHALRGKRSYGSRLRSSCSECRFQSNERSLAQVACGRYRRRSIGLPTEREAEDGYRHPHQLPGVTQEQFDQAHDHANPDRTPPKGLLFHASGPIDGGWGIIDFWESRDDFDAFAPRVMEGMTAAGIQPQGPPDIKEFPVHEMIHA